MSPLHHKLLRDLSRMKSQAFAIAVVIGIGVAMQVMMTGLVLSLSETRDAYYERYRLAEIFAPVARAPNSVADELSDIAGISSVQTRITGAASVDIPTRVLPVFARVLSLPDGSAPKLNDVLLTDGRPMNPDHPREILLLESFAIAHNLQPGDRLQATMNGAKRDFLIAGLAQSPEFIYSSAPGEMLPDDARFAVIWMGRSAIAAAFDLQGTFNEALFSLNRGTRIQTVLDEIDRVLSPYGGPGAYGRADQLSNRFVSEEISGLEVSATGVPPIFLAVAAFLLYIVISRLVQSEREEIGLLKAFGYTNGEVGWHYMQLVLVIALGGALLGCLMGIGGGRAIIPVYTTYFKFPFLLFRLEPASFVTGVLTSIAVASVGGLFVLRRVFTLAPAEAMRPPAPADYSRTGRIGASLARWLDQPSRMVLRRLTRQPWRMGGAIIGIASGMALSLSMLIIYEGFDVALDRSFNVIDRSDATASFAYTASDKTILELQRIDGVTLVEPFRQVPVILRNGLHSHQGAITGLTNGAHLYRALDSQTRPIPLPERGIVLSTALASVLDVEAGESILVEVREGRQPILSVPVTGIAESLMGAPAFMELTALNNLLGEHRRVSGAYLSVAEDRSAEVYEHLRDLPVVAGISLRSEAEGAFKEIMDQGAGSSRYIMGIMAFAITFGIVFNAASVAHAERARDLASLRVIGFHRRETAFVLLGELAIVTLIALPIGLALGNAMSFGIAAGFSTELYQIPVIFAPRAQGFAIVVVVSAALASGWLVKRKIDRADIISTLKTRE